MARKGRNIYKRKDGRWEGRIKIPAAEGGRYLSFYGHSYNEVKKKMESYEPVKTTMKTEKNMTITQAVEIWLRDNKNNWKQSTYACYMQQINKYIIPELGEIHCIDLNNITVSEIIRKYSKLSKSYRKSIFGILTSCIRYVNSLYDYNFRIPDIKFTASQCSIQETFDAKQIPSPETTKKLERYLLSQTDDVTCLGVLLTMYTGIRIGELCALTWNSIDLDSGVISINSTMQRIKKYDTDGKTQVTISIPKSLSSIRTIPIPLVVRNALKRSPEIKEGYFIKGKKKAFAEPRTVQYRFRVILKKCGVEVFNFHKLRHIFATNCLQHGFDFKTLSELMGHSSIQTTLNIYVHSDEERKRALMENLRIEVA